MKNKLCTILTIALSISLILAACEGSTGPEGPQGAQGDQGERGPVGPAGEDGSIMYAGEGAPGDDIGSIGDYYLNQNTGELYGPKAADGWGEPIIVLMGEDGQDGADGQDGQDGADGQDGSQIHAGNGAPDASLGVEGDFYLDKDSYDLYGPKTSDGWGSPLNLKGADGNANVTRYLFPGHDFAAALFTGPTCIDGVSEEEVHESAWLYYLVSGPNTNDGNNIGIRYSVPGWGIFGNTSYRVYIDPTGCFDFTTAWEMLIVDGPGEEYARIEVIRIEASNTVDNRKQKGSIIPDHLDVSNYEEVAEYYGFYHR